MLQRIQDAYDALDAPACEAVDAFAETGLSALRRGARAVSNVKIIVDLAMRPS